MNREEEKELFFRHSNRDRRWCRGDEEYGGIIKKMLETCKKDTWKEFAELGVIMSRTKYKHLELITTRLANICVQNNIDVSDVIYDEHSRNPIDVEFDRHINIDGMDFLILVNNNKMKNGYS